MPACCGLLATMHATLDRQQAPTRPRMHAEPYHWPPQVLADVRVQEPRIPVISNVTGQPFPEAAQIRAALARQLVEPVRWESTLTSLVLQGKTRMYELGPGAQVKAMVKRISPEAWKGMQNVSV